MKIKVKVYTKHNAIFEFEARNLQNAREIAARATQEGLWHIEEDGTEEFYPTTEIFKAKISFG